MCNKLNYFAFFLYLSALTWIICPASYSAENPPPPEQGDTEVSNDASSVENTEPPSPTQAPEKTLPDIQQRTFEQLKSQYPKSELLTLSAQNENFSGLWKKDLSGQAFGAVLLLPANGQTANWPHTIEVLRNDLPKNGWSTLSIDIKALPKNKPPSKQDETLLEAEVPAVRDDANTARIQAAIEFLHGEGQYNIVLAGYGNSANRALSYAGENMKSANSQQAIRALVLINSLSYDAGPLSHEYSQYELKTLPVLDLVLGSHYLDIYDAEERKNQARAQRMQTYVQLKLMEPSTTVFSQENRVSRRVRGFLNKHAKGVEIGRR